jgi:hypothetical protein
MLIVTLTFKNSEEDEAGYVVLGHPGNLLFFLPFKTFLNVSVPDALKNWKLFHTLDPEGAVVYTQHEQEEARCQFHKHFTLVTCVCR